MKRRTACVFGSVNTDIHASLPRFPAAGETIAALKLEVSGGGKGANQAFALARLGITTSILARVGRDAFGRDRRAELEAVGLDCGGLEEVAGAVTGTALVETDSSGQNLIVIAAGANALADAAFARRHRDRIAASGILLVQLETPLEGTLEALRLARAAGCLTMLDPAPARELPSEAFELADYITPNETETEMLTGIRPEDAASAEAAARILLEKGAGAALIKAGASGAWLLKPKADPLHCPSFQVTVVDTTAAGDAFNAGFAVALLAGHPEAEALRQACAVGALAVTRSGAQLAMPSRSELAAFLAGARSAKRT